MQREALEVYWRPGCSSCVRVKEFFAQELADVSQFVGRKVDFKRLPAPALMEKWFNVLGAGRRCIAQLPPELRHVLERCTWHSAQHVRQIIAVLERLGIAPEKPLTAQDYAGLPMPRGLWE